MHELHCGRLLSFNGCDFFDGVCILSSRDCLGDRRLKLLCELPRWHVYREYQLDLMHELLGRHVFVLSWSEFVVHMLVVPEREHILKWGKLLRLIGRPLYSRILLE